MLKSGTFEVSDFFVENFNVKIDYFIINPL